MITELEITPSSSLKVTNVGIKNNNRIPIASGLYPISLKITVQNTIISKQAKNLRITVSNERLLVGCIHNIVNIPADE
jgi:hypothetical protein